MADPNIFGWDASGQMTFATGREIPFTKTPANVPASYTQAIQANPSTSPAPTRPAPPPAPQSATPPSKKRKPPTSHPPPTSAKKRRTTTAKTASARPIPHSFDACSAADKALLTLRDGGHEWKAIRARWEELTNEKTGTSTLPNRYARLKSNFSVVRAEDHERLLRAKRAVEERFEEQKWELVGRTVREMGGDTYAAVVLQRQYKKLMLSGGIKPPPGIRDADFEVEDAESEDDHRQEGSDGDAEMDEDDE